MIPILIDLLEQCMDDRTTDEIKAGLRDPGVIEILAIRRAIRQEEGLRRKKLRRRIQEVVEGLASMTDGELSAVIAEAVASREKD
jgi:hypothetical protein